MLLTDARRPARTGPGGELIPMAEQDRSRWDAAAIGEGVALITATLRRLRPGPFQLQAAIAAVHDEAPSVETTDWPQILALYELLQAASDNPVVALHHAVAAAMVYGPRTGLDLLASLAADARLASGHRFHAVRAQLLELAGETTAARSAYLEAAQHTTSLPHQRYLHAQADRLSGSRC
jgi:predicted RNA polymerase sigma factor